MSNAEAEEQERCWICLGNEGDPPPLARPTDTGHLFQVCACSLRAHKRCLLDWATDIDYRNRHEGSNPGFTMQAQNNVIHLAVRGDDWASVVGLRAANGMKIYTGNDIQCPQCKRQIMMTMKPSKVLSLHRLFQNVAKQSVKATSRAVIGSTIVTSISLSLLSTFATIGYKMWSTLTGETLLMSLLDVKQSTWTSALKNDGITFRNVFQLAGFPLFLHSTRSNTNIAMYFQMGWTALSYNNGRRLQGAKLFLVAFQAGFLFYRALSVAILHPHYYRWLVETKPVFIADKLTQEELQNMEEEYRIRAQLVNEREDASSPDDPWYVRWYNWLNPRYTDEERAIRREIREREENAIVNRDYSQVFHKEGIIWKFFQTCLWPVAASGVGVLLDKFTPINGYLMPYINTPAEGTYARNLVSLVVVALVRDLVLFYVAWKEVQQYKNIDVIDSEFSGLKVDCISTVHLEPGEELPNDLLQRHMLEHGEPAAAAPLVNVGQVNGGVDVGGALAGDMWANAWARVPDINQLVNLME